MRRMARWQLKWIARAEFHQLLVGLKGFPSQLSRGFFGACGALIGLVVSDNLVAYTRTSYYQPSAYAIGAVIILISLFSRNRTWGPGWRQAVMKSIFWMFGAMGLMILGTAVQDQLNVFDGLNLSVYNVWVAIFLILGVFLSSPLFVLADWAWDVLDELESRDRDNRVPSWFDSRYVVKP